MLNRLYSFILLHRLWIVFIITGMIQMGIARLFGFHNGLEHMVFNYWWQYVGEGLFYSLCHAGMYHFIKNRL